MRTVTVSDEILNTANLFRVPVEDLLRHAFSAFVQDEIAASERRLGQLVVEEHSLRRKYGTDVDGLNRQLAMLAQTAEGFEEQTVGSVPILEAVSDTRRWEHVLERLIQEENRLQQLHESVSPILARPATLVGVGG